MSVDIRIGDCRQLLAAMPDDSVHCVVTSPPYFGLRDYGVAGQIGLEPTPDAFVAEMVGVFREVRRVLRDDGTCWLNLGDSYATRQQQSFQPSDKNAGKHSGMGAEAARYTKDIPDGLKPKDLLGIPWRVAFALQADGWYLRQDIIWAKPNPMPESVTDRCTKAHEYLFLLSKSARYFYDADAIAEENSPTSRTGGTYRTDKSKNSEKGNGHSGICAQGFTIPRNGRNRRSVWTVATQPFSEAHFATFPPDLIEPCIKAGCPKQCCAKCGAPWVRQVEREFVLDHRVNGGQARHVSADANDQGSNRYKDGHQPGRYRTETTGFAPSCACNADTVPGTVLDPFGGAGTTGLVADRLGRNAILLELNPAYAEMARRRIQNDAGMFAEVAAQ